MVQFLERKEGKIAYEVSGNGPLVVLAPSLGDLRREYRFLAPRLVEAGYQTVCMDLRGHGESSTGWAGYSVAELGSDLIALIHSLNAGPAIIIGTSISAGAGVWAAAEAPEAVSGLVLIGPAVRGEITGVMRVLIPALFARPWGPAAWKAYYSSLYPSRKPEDFQAYTDLLRRNLSEAGRLKAMKKMTLASKAESESRLRQVTAPALAIMGTRDPDFKDPEAEARWVAESLGGRYEMVQDAGHYPHAEMPETTAGLVLSFLKSLREAEGSMHVAENRIG